MCFLCMGQAMYRALRMVSSTSQIHTSPNTISIGCAGFDRMAQSKYWKQFNLVEIQETFLNPPNDATLKRWRNHAPTSAQFVIKAWQLLTHLPHETPTYRQLAAHWQLPLEELGALKLTEATRTAFEKMKQVAAMLRSNVILFETPSSFTPTAQHKKRLTTFFESVDRGTLSLAWDGRGVWSSSEKIALCRDLKLVPCLDTASLEDFREPILDPYYFKFRGVNYSASQLYHFASLLKLYSFASFVFQSDKMSHDAKQFLEYFRSEQ